MNPNEIYQFVVNLFRDGPAVAGALVVGLVGGVIAGRWLSGRADEQREKRLKELEEENADLDRKRLKAEKEANEANAEGWKEKAEHGRTREDLAKEKGQHEETRKARSAAEEDAKTHLARAEKAEAGFSRAEASLAELTPRLIAAEAKADREERRAGQAERERREVQGVSAARQREIDAAAAREAGLRTKLDHVEKLSSGLDEELHRLKEDLTRVEAEKLEALAKAADSERRYREKLAQHNKLLGHIAKVRAQAGRIWEREVDPSAPRFVPLAERTCPITAIMNLKGGVGKTTLSYFIARTLAGQGKRVLLVDLDHQRSLSMALVSRRHMDLLHSQERTLQHHLASDGNPAGFLKCVHDVPTPGTLSIVVNTYDAERAGLAATEDMLQADWMARPEGPDVRLVLRKALHAAEIQGRFDHVFLDCPPRFGTASINALAASDYLLVPVNLDGTASLAAPHFLREVRRLREGRLCPELQLLGVVANRAAFHGGDLTTNHREAWGHLEKQCRVSWGERVYFFKCKVKHAAGVGRPATEMATYAADEGVFPSMDTPTSELFTELANELKRRIADASRKPSSVP